MQIGLEIVYILQDSYRTTFGSIIEIVIDREFMHWDLLLFTCTKSI